VEIYQQITAQYLERKWSIATEGGCLMATLNELEFEFTIGQIVYHRLKLPHLMGSQPESRTPLLIVTRIAEECSGGVQLKYQCRIGVSSGIHVITMADGARTYEFHECELEA
jgi:hypothetical protein